MIDTLLIGYDLSPKEENVVLIISRKRPNESVEIVNAFQGEEAKQLYQKLITKNG